jgi:hypothetical protein
MPLAGDVIEVGRVPGWPIATDISTVDSGTFTTTETVVQSITASLVSGRTYWIRSIPHFSSTTATDSVAARLREDNLAGAELQSDVKEVMHTTLGTVFVLEYLYNATATGNKTFVLTALRTTGAGTARREAASNRPSYMYVEYVDG